MRIAIGLCIALPALFMSPPCEAGGFFRRVPEVGEYATYAWSLNNMVEIDPKDPAIVSERRGLMTLKCVGEVMIDDRRHLWIEYRDELTECEVEDYIGSWTVVKMLVPEDEIVEGQLPSEDTHGWYASTWEKPLPLEFDPNDTSNLAWWMLMSVFRGSDMVTEIESERTIVVEENEMELTIAETGPLPEQKVPILEITNEPILEITNVGVWWPSDDIAFGVASADWISSSVHLQNGTEAEGTFRFDLVATGTDAVSELPDHN